MVAQVPLLVQAQGGEVVEEEEEGAEVQVLSLVQARAAEEEEVQVPFLVLVEVRALG